MRDQLNDMQLYLIDEYVEDYQDGLLSRRDALRRIAAITGSTLFATTILAACGSEETPTATAGAAATATTASAAGITPTTGTPAPPATPGPPDPAVSVAENDPAISAMAVEFPGEGGITLMGYMARPTGDGPFPLMLVCHENRGLTDHIRDVTRRGAKAGYASLAVDLLSRAGGTAKLLPEEVSGVLGQAPEGQPVQDFQSGLRYLQEQPFADKAKVGMVGFCYGGGVTWRVATKTPELLAAVPFYGPAPKIEEVPGITAAVLAIYAEQDERINAGIADIEAAMKANNKIFEKVIYPGVNHAFHNDTGARYNPDRAKEAWAKTLEWFDNYVRNA